MYKCCSTTGNTLTKAIQMNKIHILDRLDLEVQTNETEDETFQILNQVVEHTKTFRVPDRKNEKRFMTYAYLAVKAACAKWLFQQLLEKVLTLTG